MSEMKWTAEQSDAINRDDVNILVSAAAGSGKTTVLIERILRLIIDNRVDVDRFLITTFTNAAASEMKAKLEKRISKELGKGDLDKEKRTFLQRQIRLLPDADIETFHSFAISVIRDYFFLTDLEPGFAIGDETRINLMRSEVMDAVFERRFREDTERFRSFLRKYSSERNDNRLKENIQSVYKELLSMPDYMKWAREGIEKLKTDSPVKALKIDGFIISRCIHALREAEGFFDRAANILKGDDTESIYLKARQDGERIKETADLLSRSDGLGLGQVLEVLDGLKFNSMRAAGAEKEAYDKVKDEVTALRESGKKIIKALKEKYFVQDEKVAEDILRSMFDDTAYYLELIVEVEEKLKERKREENIIDFDDVMHYAIAILEDDRAAEDYKSRFSYIFIDEYQDSNYLQERIIERIKGDDNLFMVGDVKQSIYKFRLAEPEIFREKYARFRREDEEDSVKIDLNSNFRSKGNIRRAVNCIFEEIMEGYDDEAALRGPEGGGPDGPPVELHLIRKTDRDEGGEDALDELAEYELIAGLIRKYVGTQYVDRDGNEQVLGYGDIAVLSRRGDEVANIERHLNSEDIPAYGVTDSGYYETVEIRLFIDLLKVISNMRQDLPLIAVMSSVFFAFAPSELALIRIAHREGTYLDAVLGYAENGQDEGIKKRINLMIEKIGRWKEIGRTVPLDELMRILIFETGYYDYCSSLPVGERRISNLRLLLEKAESFEKTSYSGLYGFLSYIDAMKRSGQKTREAALAGEGDNVVSVMTVHKSKGLEYPMVILAGTERSTAGSHPGYMPSVHKDFTIALPKIDRDGHTRTKTILQRAIEGKKEYDKLEEEIRILYVALTRPIDRLIILGSVKGSKELNDLPSRSSFLEMLYPAMMRMANEDPDLAVIKTYTSEEDMPGEEAGSIPDEDGSTETVISDEDREEIQRRMSFVYPHEKALSIRPKYSVTQLSADDGPHIPPRKELGEKTEQQVLSAAEEGTVMHLVMEKLDFKRAVSEGEEYIDGVVADLHRRGAISDEQKDVVSAGNIMAFFRDPVGQRAAASKKVRQENEFIMQETLEGEKVVVQGVIDCWFEEDDGLVLIDYKNSRLGVDEDPEFLVERYRQQVDLYRKALEKAEGKPVRQAWLYLFKRRMFVPL